MSWYGVVFYKLLELVREIYVGKEFRLTVAAHNCVDFGGERPETTYRKFYGGKDSNFQTEEEVIVLREAQRLRWVTFQLLVHGFLDKIEVVCPSFHLHEERGVVEHEKDINMVKEFSCRLDVQKVAREAGCVAMLAWSPELDAIMEKGDLVYQKFKERDEFFY
jgi:hypothetical protein